jgi:phenylalanyl-tRNA synthetase beta chain
MMKVSYHWLCSLLSEAPGVERVVRALTDAGLEVEKVVAHGAQLDPVRVAVVESTRPHPTSKNPLTLVTVDVGGGSSLEIVCGAPNVPPPGGRVLFAPVGTTVFTGDEKNPTFTLVEKSVAGVLSRGMLCSEVELGLGPDDSGIIVLEDAPAAGTRLVDYLPGAVDHVLEINVTPNRPDALGHRGVARDVAALLRLSLRPWTMDVIPTRPAKDDERVRVASLTEACDRFEAAVMVDVKVGRSPLWLRAMLHRLGLRSVNNVVDVSNYVMLELGQPNHCYDLDAIAERSIVARQAKDGESLETLDGVKRSLSSADVVIADALRPIGLAGVMGGEGSAITAKTQRLLIEAAHFDASAVRRMSKRHDLHSDASHRFERGVDPDCPPLAIERLKQLLSKLAGAVAVDADQSARGPRPVGAPITVTVRDARVAQVLGVAVDRAESLRIVEALGFEVRAQDDARWTVRVPSWRPDITREIDVIEEVGRVYGFDRVPLAVVPTSGARAGAVRDFTARRRVREALVALGLDEAVNYAFDADALFESIGVRSTAHIANPLSVERAAMRPTLVAGLLKNASLAVRHGEPRVRLFEVGTVFAARAEDDPCVDEAVATRANEGPLREETRVAFVLVGPREGYLEDAGGVDVLDGKGLIEALVESLSREQVRADREGVPPPWAHRAAYARLSVGERVLGYVSELHPAMRAPFRLPSATVLGEIALSSLATHAASLRAVRPSKLPSVRRDVALLVARSHPVGAVAATLRAGAGERCASVTLFDRYVGKELPEGTHSVAFSLEFVSASDKTLTDAEVDQWVKAAVARVAQEMHAVQR